VKLFLLFLAEFLERPVAAQRIPERIEFKKNRRDKRRGVPDPSPDGISSANYASAFQFGEDSIDHYWFRAKTR
jgi:hypothetical protein